MDFKTYFTGLSEPEQDAYAKRAGTTANYIRTHLIPKRKIPRNGLMKRLATESDGQLSMNNLLDHFYGDVA